MLININPLLGPDLLYTLRAMGHGDEIAIVDGNYPAESDGQRVIRADGHTASAVLNAVLSVMPIDDMVEQAVFIPFIEKDQPIHAVFGTAVAIHAPGTRIFPLKGAAFYDRVKAAHAIIATSEPALYGNIILRKGVIKPK
jgi:L-fucose mutarotase